MFGYTFFNVSTGICRALSDHRSFAPKSSGFADQFTVTVKLEHHTRCTNNPAKFTEHLQFVESKKYDASIDTMAAMAGQPAHHQPTTVEEVRTLWIGDLQYWVDESYLNSCFAHTGEVRSFVSSLILRAFVFIIILLIDKFSSGFRLFVIVVQYVIIIWV